MTIDINIDKLYYYYIELLFLLYLYHHIISLIKLIKIPFNYAYVNLIRKSIKKLKKLILIK